jgi:hypothetical protein
MIMASADGHTAGFGSTVGVRLARRLKWARSVMARQTVGGVASMFTA